MIFVCALATLLLSVSLLQLRWAYRRRRLSKGNWRSLLARLDRVEVVGLTTVAECYLHPDKGQLKIQPSEMWEIIGGLSGLAKLKANARVMLDLAVFAEKWNSVDGPVVAEMIRRDGVRLNQVALRLQFAFLFQFGFVMTAFDLQEAAAIYCLMRSRLIGLYSNSYETLVPLLEAAV